MTQCRRGAAAPGRGAATPGRGQVVLRRNWDYGRRVPGLEPCQVLRARMM